jgi:hypothetical protein
VQIRSSRSRLQCQRRPSDHDVESDAAGNGTSDDIHLFFGSDILIACGPTTRVRPPL